MAAKTPNVDDLIAEAEAAENEIGQITQAATLAGGW